MTFYRRTLPHLQRDYKPHFLTFCTYQRWNLPNWARDIVLKCCLKDDQRKFDLHVTVVMPDHVHMIFTPLTDQQRGRVFSLAEITGGFKGVSSHRINQQLARRGLIWQGESFDHVLRSSEQLDQKIAYVMDNPVRRGLVARHSDYRWLCVVHRNDLAPIADS